MSPSIDNDDFFGDHVHDWDEIYQLVCKSEQSTNPPSLLLTCFSYIFLATGQVKLIRRNRQGQDIYRTWIKETLSKYESLEDYMLKEKLKFPETVDKERPPVIVLPNDFPYSTEPGIEHHLIWSQVPLSESYVKEILEERYGSQKWEWVYFVNPPETQSIKRLPHVHVFMRPRARV